MSWFTAMMGKVAGRNGRGGGGGGRRGRGGRGGGGAPQMRMKYGPTGPKMVQLGYGAARVARQSPDGVSRGGSADSHLEYDLPTLRAESQRMARDNELYGGVIQRAVDNILGQGFGLQMQTPDKKWNDAVEAAWKEWGEAPEVRGMFSWQDLEEQVLRALFVDGDVLAVKLRDGQLQMFESEQLALSRSSGRRSAEGSAEIFLGVEIDEVGRPVAYHVSPYTRGGTVNVTDAERFAATDCVHVMAATRLSQTRGVTPLVSCLPMAHRVMDICDSEAAARQLLSKMAIAITKKDAQNQAGMWGQSRRDSNLPVSDEDVAKRVIPYDDATIFLGEPDEDIRGIDRSTVPGQGFPEILAAFVRLLGLPVGMPLELVMLDYSNTNFSSARAAIEQSNRTFTRWQRKLERGWHRPVFSWWLAGEVASGRLVPPGTMDEGGWSKAIWNKPAFPWVDPLKEAQAWGVLMDRGVATLREYAASRGVDSEEVVANRKAEVIAAIEAAAEVEKKTGKNVDWRLFGGLNPEGNVPQAEAIAKGNLEKEEAAREAGDEGAPGGGSVVGNNDSDGEKEDVA